MNQVVPKDKVLSAALAWAAEINQNSPDSVQSTKRALLLSNRYGNIEDAVVAHMESLESKRAFVSENIQVRTVGFRGDYHYSRLDDLTGRSTRVRRGKATL